MPPATTIMYDQFATLPIDDPLADVDALMMEEFSTMFLPQAMKPTTPPSNASGTPSSCSEADSPPKADMAKPKKINESRKRQREELEFLRVRVEELEKHLGVLQQVKAIETESETPWQKLAHQMRIDKQNAVLENEKLKQELEEQIEFGKTLQAILRKRPKLSSLPTLDSDQWKLYRLVKEPMTRAHAVYEILQQQLAAFPGAMVESGLVDTEADMLLTRPKLSRYLDDQLITETIWCHNFPYDYRFVTRCMWALMANPSQYEYTGFSLLETFDDDTKYICTIGKLDNLLTSQCRFLMRRLSEPGREIFLIRSILEDELMPHDKTALINNKSAWFVLEPTPGGGCRLKFYQKATLPMMQSQLFLQHPKFKKPGSPYYRVGNITDAIMTSLREMVKGFKGALVHVLQTQISAYAASLGQIEPLDNLTPSC
ncbi:hypothetical protein SDRG_13569 [Saprolegnia diclina VS20]|uniref:START domain-containing protein n=1 Tax=Saprolegnia diclina (strain VS20) TaxID=1156394 RepID=T0PT54_SAPDV|nr:hypothetical protein SDRG_13569 [Saprolegnia diclina VS20]EQC28694.1 hypothetical protein SDRG_13569 [Saprolegnia diclina VS20]|eukprot:XP_008617886.1 hypothetical protein SDRG_13569 [Saprolegnia diclina VS20]